MNIKTEIAKAKSNGTDLISHNRNVGFVGEYLAKNYLGVTSQEILDIVRESGLIHDIAKITIGFQKYLNGVTKKTNQKFQHNEIGGAFIAKYFNPKNEKLDYYVSSVYWHHGIRNNMQAHFIDDILDSVRQEDIELMKDFLVAVLDPIYLNSVPRTEMSKSPAYYLVDDEFNEIMSVVRTCVISADRIVSMIEDIHPNIEINEQNISIILDNEIAYRINQNGRISIIPNDQLNKERLDRQLEIGLNKCNQTTIIKGPAGFGKTILGLIWQSPNPRKTLWVCPRNEVAKAVYESMLEDLQILGTSDLSVELYLSGTVIKKNHENPGEFNSDIIITNIDNFLAPSINDSIADRLFLTHSANVVFDEYHEFISDSAYFACFVNLMRARTHNTTSKTLLLSATPVEIEYMWDTIGRKTLILPDKDNHYPAAHQYKYKINVSDDVTPKLDDNDLVITNSIIEAQRFHKRFPDTMLFHSMLDDISRKETFDNLFAMYGKHPAKTEKKSVVATPIARASLNISAKNLYDSCLSPEGTLQSIGRCNRWGNYGDESIITIMKLKDKNGKQQFSQSEKCVIELFYPLDLMDAWYNEMKHYNGQMLTLDEIYVIYNKHVQKHGEKRKKYFNSQYRDSLMRMIEIYPIRYNAEKSETKIYTAGSNKLRCTGNEIFFIVPMYNDGNKYVGPFSSQIYKTIDVDFNEDGKIFGRIIGSMKTIMKTQQNRFNYSEILDNLKHITLDEIRRRGKRSDTPYIRYDKVYHPNFGVISRKNLEELI